MERKKRVFCQFFQIVAENPQNVVLQSCKKWLIKHQAEAPKGNQLRRLTTLSSMISALIRGGRASLQDIGSHMEDDIDLESRIKKAKRWLTNKWVDVECHFIPYLVPILHSVAKRGELVFAIDGSGIGKDNMGLMLSLLWRKRAIPLCWLVRQASKGHFSRTDAPGLDRPGCSIASGLA